MSFDAALDGLNDALDAVFGVSAVYTPAGGAAQADTVTVIVDKHPAQLDTPPGFKYLSPGGSSEWTLEVQASAIVGGVVSKEDKFEITDVGTFVVSKAPERDTLGKMWICQLRTV